MRIIDGDKTECTRCEVVIPLADAAVLERKHNKDMEKTLCGDCLESIGVPQGYEVERDLSYLER